MLLLCFVTMRKCELQIQLMLIERMGTTDNVTATKHTCLASHKTGHVCSMKKTALVELLHEDGFGLRLESVRSLHPNELKW